MNNEQFYGLMMGKSMKPAMGVMNLVWGIDKPDYVVVGDVVGFSRSKWKSVVHRIIDIDSEAKIYIKGDNAPEVDCVKFSNIIFKVTRFRKIL